MMKTDFIQIRFGEFQNKGVVFMQGLKFASRIFVLGGLLNLVIGLVHHIFDFGHADQIWQIAGASLFLGLITGFIAKKNSRLCAN